MTYRFVVTALTHWATLFDNNFEKENVFKMMADVIVYFDLKYVTI